MMRIKSILLCITIQCFSLFSYEASPHNYHNNGGNASQVKIIFDDQNVQSSNSYRFSSSIRIIPDYENKQYNIALSCPSPYLKYFINSIVKPFIYLSTSVQHYNALPGYAHPEGLHYCVTGLSQFNYSDTALIPHLRDRLETYCTRIENIVYDDKNNLFRDNISYSDQVALVNVYADFLKEFYGNAAQQIFDNDAKLNPLLQQLKPEIKWCCFNKETIQNSDREKQFHKLASVNGNLGAIYKALGEGNNALASALGHERVKVSVDGRLVGHTDYVTSVFEKYPALSQKVEQLCIADKAKAEQERLAKETHAQQQVGIIKAKLKESLNVKTLLSGDRLQQCYNTAISQVNDPRFFEKFYALVAEQLPYISIEHLTADQKGILFEGGHYQHHLVNETISVVDTVISTDLTQNIQDVVLDLANTSLSLNKEGEVIKATNALDTCWALINCAQHVAQCVYTGVLNSMSPLERGVLLGAVDSASGAVHAVLHPIETVQEAAQSLAAVGYCVGKLVYAIGVGDAACDVLESDPKRYEEMIAHYATDPKAFAAMYEQAKNKLWYVKDNLSGEDVVRFGTKTVLDAMLLHGATKAVSAIAKEYWASLVSCMRKAGQSTEVVATTAEGISAKCGEEIASMVHKMESAQKAGSGVEVIAEAIDGGAKNAAAKTEKSAAHQIAKRHGKQGSPTKKISKPTHHARPLDSLKDKELIGIENVTTSGYKPLHKHISFANYKHYLKPEIRTTSTGKLKPSGWHHDIGRRIEKIKRINGHKIDIINKEIHPSGIYRFDWGVEGMQKKRSTFFPHTWSRETVQSKIREAYKYARKHHIMPELQPNGNFFVNGFTNDGIVINIVIDQKGMVVTGYPVWPK